MSVLETWRNDIDLPVLETSQYVDPAFSSLPLIETRGPSGIVPALGDYWRRTLRRDSSPGRRVR